MNLTDPDTGRRYELEEALLDFPSLGGKKYYHLKPLDQPKKWRVPKVDLFLPDTLDDKYHISIKLPGNNDGFNSKQAAAISEAVEALMEYIHAPDEPEKALIALFSEMGHKATEARSLIGGKE